MDKKTIMESLARKAYEKDSFNGAWLYAENGGIVSKGTFGWRDPEGIIPIEENTIFQLASVTKQFTAAAVMLVIRTGLLSLDDKITEFFPEIPYPGVVRYYASSVRPRQSPTVLRERNSYIPTPATTFWRCWWSGSPAFRLRSFCRRTFSSLQG